MVHQLFNLHNEIGHYLTNGSNMYICHLGATKAFDLLNFRRLFNNLLQRKKCPLVLLVSYLIAIHVKNLKLIVVLINSNPFVCIVGNYLSYAIHCL